MNIIHKKNVPTIVWSSFNFRIWIMKIWIEYWHSSFFLFIKKIVETKATILECARRRRRHQCNNGFPLSSVGVVPASPFSNYKWKSISTGGGYTAVFIFHFLSMILSTWYITVKTVALDKNRYVSITSNENMHFQFSFSNLKIKQVFSRVST